MAATMRQGKIIIISAPSGCGKSTIIGKLLERGEIDMRFSVSATSRAPRGAEQNGVHYWFLTEAEFIPDASMALSRAR